MKLIYCPNCQDIRKLQKELTFCVCAESWGVYDIDGCKASINGKAIPIGFNNASFADALRNRPQYGMGRRFEAFVIPENCDSIEQNDQTYKNI